MKEEFILFLKRKRILTKFKKNLMSQNVMNQSIASLWSGHLDEYPEDAFSIAFTWDGTEEGYKFWRQAEFDWETYLKTGKTNKS